MGPWVLINARWYKTTMTNSPLTTQTPTHEVQHLLLITGPQAYNEGIATLCRIVG